MHPDAPFWGGPRPQHPGIDDAVGGSRTELRHGYTRAWVDAECQHGGYEDNTIARFMDKYRGGVDLAARIEEGLLERLRPPGREGDAPGGGAEGQVQRSDEEDAAAPEAARGVPSEEVREQEVPQLDKEPPCAFSDGGMQGGSRGPLSDGSFAVAYRPGELSGRCIEALVEELQLEQGTNNGYLTLAANLAGRAGSSTRPEVAGILLACLSGFVEEGLGVDSAAAIAAVTRQLRRHGAPAARAGRPWQLFKRGPPARH